MASSEQAPLMPNKFRSLVASGDDEFRAELVERAIGLNFSVRAIRSADELREILRTNEFDWLFLDVGLGRPECLRIIEALSVGWRPRTILVGVDDTTVLDPIRRSAIRAGLDIIGVLRRPLSFPALARLLTALGAKEQDASDSGLAARHLDSIPSGEVVVHYQPIVAMPDRSVGRVEALVRWRHPAYGLIRPERFISLAERSGAIIPLTWDVLTKAMDQHVTWRAAGTSLSISVNLSALFLTSSQVADDILALLHDKHCDPRLLVLEITETEAVPDSPVARTLLTKLRDAGVSISMDDYGVGHSSLERLRYFPFSDLKIDRGLVAAVDSSQEARDAVATLVDLARRETFRLTGEGIETQQQWDVLVELGCDFGQGFLIARPMPADQVEGWIRGMARAGIYRLPQPA